MNTRNRKIFIVLMLFSICSFYPRTLYSRLLPDSTSKAIDLRVKALMKEGNIPGLSLVIIEGNTRTIKNFGYADLETKKRIIPGTLFELGSCSKAFTALAIGILIDENKLNLDDNVTEYIPWFMVKYKTQKPKITIRQLLHHTSGIPWSTLSKIPVSNRSDALQETIKQLKNQELNNLPGKKYEYATINYDVLALIIERITHQSFETFIRKNVFKRLRLNHTEIGMATDSSLLSVGYKISFFKPMPYKAPVFRGNNAAGYVVSDAVDISRWLQLQMGIISSQYSKIIELTQQRDETVPLHNMTAYAMGWEVALNGTEEIFHYGLNPNYSSYIAFRTKKKVGIAVLANSNSSFTGNIGNAVMDIIEGEEMSKNFQPDESDKTYSFLSFILGFYIFVVLVFIGVVCYRIVNKRRKYEGLFLRKAGKFLVLLAFLLPFVYGIYVFPKAIAGFTWQSTLIWTPLSFKVTIGLILLALCITCFAYLLSLCFPEKSKLKGMAPQILLMSILSGLSNMGMIVLVTSALNSTMEIKYKVLYYVLILFVYFMGSRFVKINLIRITSGLIYELRIRLLEKIFSTSYQKFEKIDRGRIYTGLNEDVGTIGDSLNMSIMLITNFFTVAGAFLYLGSIAFWATISFILLVIGISILYAFVSRSAQPYFNEARDSKDVFMRLANGLIDGFKEISLHKNRKLEYQADVASSANEYKNKISTASIRFVNASVVGESLLIILLGTIAFGLPTWFPNIQSHTVMSFIVILLYLIGPITGLQNSVPAIIQLRIAWNRIQQLLKEITIAPDLEKEFVPVPVIVERIQLKGVKFRYKNKQDREVFAIGPIDLEIKKGEILFIIGGNGSGKSTLAKLLSGLYEPDEGSLIINEQKIDSALIGEYFSAVFNPFFLFEKLYNIDVEERSEEANRLLKLLNLDHKVDIIDNKYSTIDLSGGQRKRLALLQCYMEDLPIYLFDEWAADQDPEYRDFFYRTLLPQMKQSGKIVIAITHDSQYFDVADKVMKMEDGRLKSCKNHYLLTDKGLL